LSEIGEPCNKCGEKLKNICPECGKEMETYSRVVGYFRPVERWNEGKKQEWRERKVYTEIEEVHKRPINVDVINRETQRMSEMTVEQIRISKLGNR